MGLAVRSERYSARHVPTQVETSSRACIAQFFASFSSVAFILGPIGNIKSLEKIFERRTWQGNAVHLSVFRLLVTFLTRTISTFD